MGSVHLPLWIQAAVTGAPAASPPRVGGKRGGGGGVRWSPSNPDDPSTPAPPDAYSNESVLRDREGKSHGLRGTTQRGEVRSQNAAQQKWHGDEGSPGVSSTSSSASRNPHGMGKSLFHGRRCITLLKDSENASLAGSKGSQGDSSFECSDDAGSFGRHGVSCMKKLSHPVDENQVLAGAGSGNAIDTSSEKGHVNESSSSMRATCHYDICPPKAGTTFTLKLSLLEKNREMRNIVRPSMEGPKEKVLRSGMVLLKNYISIAEQVKIIKTCRRLGMGHGGFYRPAYRDGAKLNLHMMCLGKNWDPEERIYGSIRSNDGTKPPAIPQDFIQLVKKTMKTSHEVISEESGVRNAVNMLPNVSPDICLVNFYSTSGKLGLHQDRDENRDSLDKGVPVVSFSIGDSAEFLYGDQRDIEKAEKVSVGIRRCFDFWWQI